MEMSFITQEVVVEIYQETKEQQNSHVTKN